MKAIIILITLTLMSCSSRYNIHENLGEGNKASEKEQNVKTPPPIETIVSESNDTDNGEVLIDFFEEQALFDGKPAETSFPEYVAKNINYQLYNIGGSLSGRVFVEFVEEKDGTISNAKVIRNIDPLLDAEALRLINSSSKWTPAKLRGEPVRVKYVLPVNFNLYKVK